MLGRGENCSLNASANLNFASVTFVYRVIIKNVHIKSRPTHFILTGLSSRRNEHDSVVWLRPQTLQPINIKNIYYVL
jgi:hypothetical protein